MAQCNVTQNTSRTLVMFTAAIFAILLISGLMILLGGVVIAFAG